MTDIQEIVSDAYEAFTDNADMDEERSTDDHFEYLHSNVVKALRALRDYSNTPPEWKRGAKRLFIDPEDTKDGQICTIRSEERAGLDDAPMFHVSFEDGWSMTVYAANLHDPR